MSCLDVAMKAVLLGTRERASLDVTRQPLLHVLRQHVFPHVSCSCERLLTGIPGAGDSSFLQVHFLDMSLTIFHASELAITGRTGDSSFTGVRARVSLPQRRRWRSVVTVRTLALDVRLASWCHVVLSALKEAVGPSSDAWVEGRHSISCRRETTCHATWVHARQQLLCDGERERGLTGAAVSPSCVTLAPFGAGVSVLL